MIAEVIVDIDTQALDQVYDLVKDKIINVFGSNNKAE